MGVPVIAIDSNTILPSIDINFRVSAGPGAGKTHWLVEHLKNVLLNSKRLGKVSKISCITYTNIGVETIRSRLGQCADQVEVSSIHSFLFGYVLRPYLSFVAEEYGINIQKVDGHTDTILSGYSFLSRWKTETKQARITDDVALVKALKGMRWRFNEKGDLEVNTSYPHKIGGYAIKKTAYYQYKLLAWEKGILHHDDVLFLSYQILVKFPFVIDVLIAKFRYFFIDEFQDSNPIQVAIIALLGKRGAFVGIIGDIAQSIYRFQGAKPAQFRDFQLPGLVNYVMSDNRRSSNQIINLLNTVRSDIVQVPWRKSDLALPIIFVGSMDAALKTAKLMCAPEAVHSLSRDNITSNVMKRELGSGAFSGTLISDLQHADSNAERRGLVIAIIKSVELARLNNFRDAIKELKKGLRKIPNYSQEDKEAIKLIIVLLRDYSEFSVMSLFEFSNYIKSTFVPGVSKVTGGKAKIFYDKTSYQDLAICVQIGEDKSLHRTIHKAKGDEFDNVLLLLSDSSKFDFVLAPDLLADSEKSEEQRVNYVAISRAKNRLFICVPELSTTSRDALKNSFVIETV